MNIQIGDHILYGYDTKFFKDEICFQNGKYYGEYLDNHAKTEGYNSLKDLLKFYLDTFANVSILRDNKTYILKNLKEDLEKGQIILERKIDNITIKIINYNKKKYYVEIKNSEIVLIEEL